MTEQKIKKLRAKIRESRGRLMSSNPFFALLLMYPKYIAVPGMKKISTNGSCIYFSPDFLEKLYWRELDFILCHQLMHIILGDVDSPIDYRSDDYHLACDIRANTLLRTQGFEESKYAHLGNISSRRRTVEEAFSLSPEEILSSLPFSLSILDERARSRYLPDSDIFWGQQGSAATGVLILDAPEDECLLSNRIIRTDSEDDREPDEDGNGSEVGNPVTAKSGGVKIYLSSNIDTNGNYSPQLWKARAAAALELMKNISLPCFDNSSGLMERIIGKLKESTVDWRKILNDFLQERICDYSFSPPDRRFESTGFFLPAFNAADFVSQDILFMVDTSGSVSDDSLSSVYSEIRGAIEQFEGKLCGKLGFFDTVVTEPLPLGSVSDLLNILPYGGGGTDFRVIFDYVKNRCGGELPACIVIFTDGCGEYPSENETLGIPVLWMINNDEITPPFGVVVRVTALQ